MKISFKTALLVVISVGFASLASGQKKTIDVDFEIKEQSYRLFYRHSVGELEAKGADSLAKKLQQEIPFIQFSGQDGEIKMTFTLDRQKTGLSNSLIHRIDLYMGLVFPNGTSKQPIAHEFRSEERMDSTLLPNTDEAFLEELVQVLSFWLEQEKEAIILEVFSQVSLGNKAHPDPQENKWAMPFSQESLNIGIRSEILVDSKIKTVNTESSRQYVTEATGVVLPNAPAYPIEYHGNMTVRLIGGETIDMTGEVNVQGIYLIKFRKFNQPQPEEPVDDDL